MERSCVCNWYTSKQFYVGIIYNAEVFTAQTLEDMGLYNLISCT
ncbi:MAG: hypothetical protein ACLR6T_07475 [Intestinibacter sp.]